MIGFYIQEACIPKCGSSPLKAHLPWSFHDEEADTGPREDPEWIYTHCPGMSLHWQGTQEHLTQNFLKTTLYVPGSIPGSERSPRVGNGRPTLVFLPGKFHEQRSLMSCHPRGVTKRGTWLSTHTHRHYLSRSLGFLRSLMGMQSSIYPHRIVKSNKIIHLTTLVRGMAMRTLYFLQASWWQEQCWIWFALTLYCI